MNKEASAHYRLEVGPGQSATVRLRVIGQAAAGPSASTGDSASLFGAAFGEILAARRQEADSFYASITPPSASEDEARVMRQALAGMLWSKQYYYFHLDDWLSEHHANFLRGDRKRIRNRGLGPHGERRHHLDAGQVGVSVVRVLGPGPSHHRPRHGRL